MPPERRVEVVEAEWTPGLTKDRARLLLLLLFGAQFERKSGEREESREGEAA